MIHCLLGFVLILKSPTASTVTNEVNLGARESIERYGLISPESAVTYQDLPCAPPTFFFRGRCYDKCPSQTYVMKHNDMMMMMDNVSSNTIPYQSEDEIDEELQSLERKRRYHYKALKVNEVNSDKETTTTGNEDYFGPNIMLSSCALCDITCRHCYGPLNSQCNLCFPGSQLRRIPFTNDTYCYVFAERSSGNNSHDNHSTTVQLTQSRFNFLLPLLNLLPTFITIIVIVFLIIYGWNYCLSKRTNNGGEMIAVYGYDRVALINSEDDEVEDNNIDGAPVYNDDSDDDQNDINNDTNDKEIVNDTVIKIYTDIEAEVL
uniref:Uncharacterized protein n=1 Tax=Glossina brevipalpis TaxID=37001 RepID=A0A1A9W8V6_9MUSC